MAIKKFYIRDLLGTRPEPEFSLYYRIPSSITATVKVELNKDYDERDNLASQLHFKVAKMYPRQETWRSNDLPNYPVALINKTLKLFPDSCLEVEEEEHDKLLRACSLIENQLSPSIRVKEVGEKLYYDDVTDFVTESLVKFYDKRTDLASILMLAKLSGEDFYQSVCKMITEAYLQSKKEGKTACSLSLKVTPLAAPVAPDLTTNLPRIMSIEKALSISKEFYEATNGKKSFFNQKNIKDFFSKIIISNTEEEIPIPPDDLVGAKGLYDILTDPDTTRTIRNIRSGGYNCLSSRPHDVVIKMLSNSYLVPVYHKIPWDFLNTEPPT